MRAMLKRGGLRLGPLLAVFVLCSLGQAVHAGEVSAFTRKLLDAGYSQIGVTTSYDPSYEKLSYPGGDVPLDRGVCTDVVIRAYRGLGIDLQVLVHEDMAQNFARYPQKWKLSRPDPNIDHRRVGNLQVFFERHGQVLPVTSNTADYRPGDLVTFMLPGHLPHIGIVTDKMSGGEPMVLHNIGEGAKLETILFTYERTGHYRYEPVPKE